MRSTPVLLALSLAGCGSYWDLREGLSLDVDCDTKLNYYLDLDGDGWGEPSATPEPLCAPDPANNLTASNNRDCDDAVDAITARIESCPAAIVDESGDYLGVVRGGSEYLALDRPEGWRYSSAFDPCLGWAGDLPATDADGLPLDKGLAQLKDSGELNDLLQVLEDGGWTDTPMFVGIAWNGSDWAWEDGTPLDGTVGFCNNDDSIVPADFYPNAVDSGEVVERSARLALIRNGNQWCWGIPGDADATTDDRDYANVLCERPTPVEADYEDVPGEG